jgi:GNAT superfamily N-acetyltransferase
MYLPVADHEIPEIVALMNRAYRDNTGRGWATEQAYLEGDRTTESLLRADMEHRPSASLLKWVEAGERTIGGCVWLEPLAGSLWYLGSLAIDPGNQNGGRGRVMLSAAEDWARERGAERMKMSVVNVRDALIAWYMRRGYEITGEVEPFPYGDNRFGRPLRDDLCFIVLEKLLAPAADD